ncbi:MAG TPA: hypothetical protein VK187_09860, partial [Geobacteraceae bacterium]|nr:hypothetical protein [Geobacteraceae bacterium]
MGRIGSAMKKGTRVMQSRPVKVAAVLAMILAFGACTAKKEQPKMKPPVPVAVAGAVQKTVPVQIRAIGNVEA